jgi:hypothetical protein
MWCRSSSSADRRFPKPIWGRGQRKMVSVVRPKIHVFLAKPLRVDDGAVKVVSSLVKFELFPQLPAAPLIGVMDDRIALPLLCTVQAPQRAIRQPNFVPVSPSVSRKYHNSGMSGSASKLRSTPFTLSFTILGPLPHSDKHSTCHAA